MPRSLPACLANRGCFASAGGSCGFAAGGDCGSEKFLVLQSTCVSEAFWGPSISRVEHLS